MLTLRLEAMRGRTALHVGVLVIVTLVAYAGSFSGQWISDDVTAIARNPLVRSLAPANLHRIATTFDDANYIPLKVLSLAIDHQLFGDAPPGYHATNLALHIANALLVYVMLTRVGARAGVALAVAILWAVHPVQVESVAWVSERKNVLSTLFFLLAFLTYLRFSDRPRPGTYVALLVLFVAALLSKINTIVLPAIMLGYELAYRSRLRTRDVLATLPLLAVGAVIAWVNLAGNPVHGGAYHGGSFWVTLRTTLTVIPRYVGSIVAPLDLASYYDVPLRASWLESRVLVSTVAVAVALVATAVLIWRGRPLGFWLAWFFVTLAPMLNLVPFPARMADRYLYIPLVGALVPLVWLVDALAARVAAKRALPWIAGAAALACAVLTIRRVPAFHDDFSLWADWAKSAPYISSDRPYGPPPRTREIQFLRDQLARHETGVLRNNIGALAFEENRIPEALAELTRARELAPDDPSIALNLGRTQLYARQVDAAVRTLQDAVRLEPPSYYAHLNLARAYLASGDVPRAADAVARARAIRPTWFDLPPVEAAIQRAAQQRTTATGG